MSYWYPSSSGPECAWVWDGVGACQWCLVRGRVTHTRERHLPVFERSCNTETASTTASEKAFRLRPLIDARRGLNLHVRVCVK